MITSWWIPSSMADGHFRKQSVPWTEMVTFLIFLTSLVAWWAAHWPISTLFTVAQGTTQSVHLDGRELGFLQPRIPFAFLQQKGRKTDFNKLFPRGNPCVSYGPSDKDANVGSWIVTSIPHCGDIDGRLLLCWAQRGNTGNLCTTQFFAMNLKLL